MLIGIVAKPPKPIKASILFFFIILIDLKTYKGNENRTENLPIKPFPLKDLILCEKYLKFFPSIAFSSISDPLPKRKHCDYLI